MKQNEINRYEREYDRTYRGIEALKGIGERRQKRKMERENQESEEECKTQ